MFEQPNKIQVAIKYIDLSEYENTQLLKNALVEINTKLNKLEEENINLKNEITNMKNKNVGD